MTDKWNKLRILTEWLDQGRELEVEGVRYAISEEGNILQMFSDDKGVELHRLSHIWNIIEKIDEKEFFLMSSEVALTKMGRENANKRINTIKQE